MGPEQSKFFTQGCDQLTVVTDHKPLISLLGQKSLKQVPNTRLFRIKQRISSWKFRIIHCPGKANFFAGVQVPSSGRRQHGRTVCSSEPGVGSGYHCRSSHGGEGRQGVMGPPPSAGGGHSPSSSSMQGVLPVLRLDVPTRRGPALQRSPHPLQPQTKGPHSPPHSTSRKVHDAPSHSILAGVYNRYRP